MSVMVTVEFNLKPEAAEGFLETMKATLPDTRGFKGCQMSNPITKARRILCFSSSCGTAPKTSKPI